MKLSSVVWVFICAAIWLAAGTSLLIKGVFLLQNAYWLLALSFLVGAGKAVFVLSKSVKRMVARLQEKKEHSFSEVFTFRLILLVGGMICLGKLLRIGGIPPLAMGVIDAAVGFALLTSSFFYVHQGRKIITKDFT